MGEFSLQGLVRVLAAGGDYTPTTYLIICISLVVAVPAVVGAIKSVYEFHGSFVRRRRVYELEDLLGLCPDGWVEREVLTQIHAQELVFLASGLRVSRIESEVIRDWMARAPVNMRLIRLAWPEVRWRDGCLFPFRNSWQNAYLIYCLIVFFLSSFFVVSIAFLAISSVLSGGFHWGYVVALGLMVAMLYVMFSQVALGFAAMRLRKRLEQAGFGRRSESRIQAGGP